MGTFQRITHPDDLNLILEQLPKLRDGTIPSLQLEQRYFHKRATSDGCCSASQP